MSKFIKKLSLFIAGASVLTKGSYGLILQKQEAVEPLTEPGPVSLRPLNMDVDNLFAGHRSHSSHRSHASHSSHYSGSGGGAYYAPTPSPSPYYRPSPSPAPAPSFEPSNRPSTSSAPSVSPNRLGDIDKVSGDLAAGKEVELTRQEKVRLQIMRVQIRLTSLGLYEGPVNGARDDPTVQAIEEFQQLKGLEVNGLMTTATLNALGIPAVK